MEDRQKEEVSGSTRLDRARRLLNDFNEDFTAPPQFLLEANPNEAPPLVEIVDVEENVVYDGVDLSGAEERREILSTRWDNGVKVATPVLLYSPDLSSNRYLTKPFKWIKRNAEIALPLAKWFGGVVFDVVTGKVEERQQSRANELLKAINSLGPAIIKGGQALASRPDLLPKVYLEELQKLQDDVPRFDDDVAFEIVNSELGVPFDELFELIGDGPVAAASIGQVYKARLKATGDIVAVKIQRPNCEDTIALDLYILRWWSGIANVITQGILKRDVNVISIIDDFGELIYREIDYVAEAANAQRFNEIYASLIDTVAVPKVISALTTSKVLVMEWVDGIRLTDASALQSNNLDREDLIDSLVQCSVRQILDNGFFHADPHAGNLLAVTDEAGTRLCYLDFGMMGYANEEQRKGFLLAVVHMVNRDWNALVLLFQQLGFIPEGEDLSVIEAALERALPDVLNADVSELNFKNVINKLGDVFYTFPFSLPPFYISIIRCLGVLEGLAIQVDPKFRIISDAYPYIASRLLTDPQPDMQEALKRLALTKDGELRWDRLEGLLQNAQGSSGYDVVLALEGLSEYLLSDEADPLAMGLADEVVELVDRLGVESVEYIINIFKAFTMNDERSLVLALRALQAQLIAAAGVGSSGETVGGNTTVNDLLPEAPETLQRAGRILTLLAGGIDTSEASVQIYVSKYLPFARKLVQKEKFRKLSSIVIGNLSERFINRGIRSVFGVEEGMAS